MYVVDVSYHNGSIDWKKAKASGVKAAIIRCGYGRDFTKYDDSKYHVNMRGALSSGIKVGIYLYSYARDLDSVRSEAKHALRLAEPYRDEIELPIFFDTEEKGTESISKAACKCFCEIIEENGYKAGVYASADWYRENLGGDELSKYVEWVAKWSEPEPKGFSNMQLWQYSAYGSIPGIGSGVDLDKPYGEILDIIEGKKPEPKGDVVEVEMPVLRYGSVGPEVKTVQRILKELGYKGKNKKVLTVDGIDKDNTDYAIKCMQEDVYPKCGEADGVVGTLTWNYLLKEA